MLGGLEQGPVVERAGGRPSPRGSGVVQCRPPRSSPTGRPAADVRFAGYRPCDRILKVWEHRRPFRRTGARAAVSRLADVRSARPWSPVSPSSPPRSPRCSPRRPRCAGPGRERPHQGAWTLAPRAVRARLGRARDRRLDRLGPRHLPGVLPARRSDQRPVARARHRVPADGPTVGDRVRVGLLVFTGVGIGVMLAAPMHGAIAATGIPVGKDHFGVLPACARRRRQRARRDRRVRRRGVVGGSLRPVAPTRLGPARGRQRADRARHARVVERRVAAGHRRLRRSVRVHARGRDRGDLRGLRGRVGRRAVRRWPRADAEPADRRSDSASDDSSRRSNLPANDRGSSSTSSTRVGSL